MSWSIRVEGTRESVIAKLEEQFAYPLKSYAGQPEGEDVALVKKVVLEAVATLDLPMSHYYSDEVFVTANGSRSGSATMTTAVSFSLSVSRVPRPPQPQSA